MNNVLERIKGMDEQSRYAYADAVTNALLTSQIQALQEARGLNQEQLAALVGTKQSGISRWLNTGFSTCKVETLRKFSRALGVRLRISFEGFGTLPSDIGGFTEEHLAPRKLEDDPAFAEPSQGTALKRYVENLKDRAPMNPGHPRINELVGEPSVPEGKPLPVSVLPPQPSSADVLITNPRFAPKTETRTKGGRRCLKMNKSPRRHRLAA